MTILSNIVNNPKETKYHKLKLSNKTMIEMVSSNMECVNLLEILGFRHEEDVISEKEGLQTCMLMTQSEVMDNLFKLRKVLDLLAGIHNS
mgnify:CR=1 FL=1|jgi:hypothetical protein